jgi:hypothetical protein
VIISFNNFISGSVYNINTFMSKEQQLEAPVLPPRTSDPKKEKLDKTIRISSYNYDRLARLGDISWDFNDALTLNPNRKGLYKVWNNSLPTGN